MMPWIKLTSKVFTNGTFSFIENLKLKFVWSPVSMKWMNTLVGPDKTYFYLEDFVTNILYLKATKFHGMQLCDLCSAQFKCFTPKNLLFLWTVQV